MSGNPLKTVTDALIGGPLSFGAKALGMEMPSDVLERELGTPEKMPDMEATSKPPTMEGAMAAARNSDMMRKKTYGRSGTIKNMGGSKGVASSLLNLSSPSLTGK